MDEFRLFEEVILQMGYGGYAKGQHVHIVSMDRNNQTMDVAAYRGLGQVVTVPWSSVKKLGTTSV